MGAGMFNVYSERHWQDVAEPVVEYRDHVHFGNQQIDTLSPWFGPSRYQAHKTAAPLGQPSFDAAYSTTASAWYSTLTDAAKAALRKSYL